MVVLGTLCAGSTHQGHGFIHVEDLGVGGTQGSWTDGAPSEDDDCASGTFVGTGGTYSWSVAEGVVAGDSCELSLIVDRQGEDDQVLVERGRGTVTPGDPDPLVLGDESVAFTCSWASGGYWGTMTVDTV